MRQIAKNLFEAVALAPIPGGLLLLVVILALSFVVPPVAAVMWVTAVGVSYYLVSRRTPAGDAR